MGLQGIVNIYCLLRSLAFPVAAAGMVFMHLAVGPRLTLFTLLALSALPVAASAYGVAVGQLHRVCRCPPERLALRYPRRAWQALQRALGEPW